MNAVVPNIRKRKRMRPRLLADASVLSQHNFPMGDLRLQSEYVSVDSLVVPKRQPRKHPKEQVEWLSEQLEMVGQLKPIVVDSHDVIVTGMGIFSAIKALGWSKAMIIRVEHLTPLQLEAFKLFDNKIAEKSKDDTATLAEMFKEFEVEEIDFSSAGFEMFEVDAIFAQAEADKAPEPENIPEPPLIAVTKPGDLWLLGKHKLLCGSALEPDSYATLMGNERATMVVTDPPYNVPIAGNVSGLGKKKHDDFVMGCGELTRTEFTDFLSTSFRLMAQYSVDGAIHYACMDWKHGGEMLEAGEANYTELKNLLVWNKGHGGMGAFYRSQHEFIYVWKVGNAAHINNFGLGGKGRRTRTNVITMPGANSFSRTRQDDLAAHSTVKPTPLFADLMLDVSRRGDIVLDPFCGSGTTLLAAERTGRRARCMELDPKYVDVAIARWQAATGLQAIHAQTGQSFEVFAQASTSSSEGEAS